MPHFGVCGLMTDRGIQPVDLARWLEAEGFESLWFGEHTHSPDPGRSAARDPEGYDQLYDPYVTLAAAAAVTRTLKLGVAVSLLPQHHPISLAKTVATLDRIASGRLLFGIGAGSRREEVEDFGFSFDDRWKVVREFVAAMRAIWNDDLAEYAGRYVRFGPMRSWPKPLRPNGPPLLEGAFSRWTARRIATYADGWIGWDGVSMEQTLDIVGEIRAEWARAGRASEALDLTMVMRPPPADVEARGRIRSLLDAGFGRVLFLLHPDEPAAQWSSLQRFARLMRAAG